MLYFLVDWTELQNEEQYRQKLRDEQEMRENQLIVWDDEKEREFRQKYINQRQVSGKCRINKLLVQHQKHSLKVSSKTLFFRIISHTITRKKQLLEANWDEYLAQEESRERIKRIQVY